MTFSGMLSFALKVRGLQCGKALKMHCTVWKCDCFSITQILHEINFGHSGSAKSAILTHLEVLNVDFL